MPRNDYWRYSFSIATMLQILNIYIVLIYPILLPIFCQKNRLSCNEFSSISTYKTQANDRRIQDSFYRKNLFEMIFITFFI